MAKSLTTLASPFKLGSMQLKNRMAVMAMGVNLAEEDGSCGDRLLAFHERQAEGGVGLIILEGPGPVIDDDHAQPVPTSPGRLRSHLTT